MINLSALSAQVNKKRQERQRVQSQRRCARLLRAIRRGREWEMPDQLELSEWIEDAARNGNIYAVQQLFPLLERDCFSEERWFELQTYLKESQKPVEQLEAEIERLQRQAEDLEAEIKRFERETEILRSQLYPLQYEIQAKRENLRQLRGEKVPRSKNVKRCTKQKLRFTGIVIRVDEHEGRINPLLFTLGILKEGDHDVGSEIGMQLLLKAGYQVEVIRGNEITPTGTIFSRLDDLL
jgi:chromosome segregation ATPase